MKSNETLKYYGVNRKLSMAELVPEIKGMMTQSCLIRMDNRSFITVERVDVLVDVTPPPGLGSYPSS